VRSGASVFPNRSVLWPAGKGSQENGLSVGKPVTLRDVAKVSGVSPSTVSRVLNGGGRVSPDTRARIEEAADRLDFRPNALAQFFARGKSHTIGMLTQNALGTFAMPVLIGVNTASSAQDMATLMYDYQGDAHTLAESVRKLNARHIDALLVVGDGFGSTMPSLSASFSVPVVYVFGMSADTADTSFLPDSVMAGNLAGEHLISIGRTRIAHITAAHDLAARDRARGLRDALDVAGLSLVLDQPLTGDWSRQWGAAAARRLLAEAGQVDGIFCANDQIAIGAYTVLRDAGVRIPEDIAIVGFDHWSRLSDSQSRVLTTIDPNLRELGATAVDYALRAINGHSEPGIHSHACTLVIGDSTVGADAGSADNLDKYLS
jgi:LacI family transcriptional regulator